jgi:glyoxylase-like metal-dependent hydrolase (beta-lactamase superfamily II)
MVKRNSTSWLVAALVVSTGAVAKHDDDERVNPRVVAARQKFFGAENVNPATAGVEKDTVIFSWVTNSTLAVSLRGRIVLLDSYINRLELPPAPGTPDLRRSPIDVQDLVDLRPEAIFLGHGHGDHADNAA